MPADVGDGREDVNVEAACLNYQPNHAVSPGALNRAGAIRLALEDFISECHLSVKDRALIDEDGERVANAREELPCAIPVRDFELILLIFNGSL